MAPFPQDLPPTGLDDVYKLLIYYGILFVLATAVTSWLITRKRRSSSTVETVEVEREHEMLNFADTKDSLASMKVEIASAESALSKLSELINSGELSQLAHDQLSSQFTTKITIIQERMSSILRADMTDSTGTVIEGISDEDMDVIQADLEQQLMDMDDDDTFLRSTSGRAPEMPLPEKIKPTHVAAQPKAAQPMPPSTPMGATSAPVPPQTPTASTPMAPPTPPSSLAPQPSSSAAAPPPPPSKSSAAPPAPMASQPLSAAQPIKVKAEGDEEGMFAKSTSIAALRMDMLRELARLKKLIPEDQERD